MSQPQLPQLVRTASTHPALDASPNERSLSPALACLLSAGGAGAGGRMASGSVAGGPGDGDALLASLGLPADTVVVDPQYYMGGPTGPAAADSTLNTK
jgi:hypothetical protein